MTTPRRNRVLLMYGNGGGGHKASALAVQDVLSSSLPDSSPSLDIQLVDAAAISGAAAGDWLYNVLLSYNAVSAIDFMHSFIQRFWFLAKPGLLNAFRKYWKRFDDLSVVVSFVPMLNAVFAETLPNHVTLFTVMTDFSHTNSHPWIQHPRQHMITGTDISYEQAISMGHTPPSQIATSNHVTQTSGMVVHPRFYNPLEPALRQRKLVEMKLNSRIPTVLILFGGSPPTDTVVQLVDLLLARSAENAVNIIAVCSRNTQLHGRLVRRQTRNADKPLFVTAFTKEIPLLMQLSNLLIGKPGPGVVTEAFVSALPSVLITGADGRNVMKQEKDVLDWVQREGIAKIAHNTQQAASITGEEIEQMQDRINGLPPNRAVFQVRDLILAALEPPQQQFLQHVSEGDQHLVSIEDLIPQMDLTELEDQDRNPVLSPVLRTDDLKERGRDKSSDRTKTSNSVSPVTIRTGPERNSMSARPRSCSSGRAAYACYKGSLIFSAQK